MISLGKNKGQPKACYNLKTVTRYDNDEISVGITLSIGGKGEGSQPGKELLDHIIRTCKACQAIWGALFAFCFLEIIRQINDKVLCVLVQVVPERRVSRPRYNLGKDILLSLDDYGSGRLFVQGSGVGVLMIT